MARAKRLDLVATDGRRAVRLVKLSISGDSGIYGLFLHRSVKMHRSYHRNGTVHLKADGPMERVKGAEKIFKESGYSHDANSGPPLDSFTGHFRSYRVCFVSIQTALRGVWPMTLAR